MTTKEAIAAQDQYVNDLTSSLKQQLDDVFQQLLIRVSGQLQRQIKFAAGPTLANRRELRKIANSILGMTDSMGVPGMVEDFVKSFEGSLPYFDRILETISQSLKSPLVRTKTNADLMVLEGVKEGSQQGIEAAVEVMVAQAKRSLLFRVAALDFESTVENLRQIFGRGVADAETLATTGLTMFLRANADQNFKAIEAGFPGVEIRYQYEGPDDKLTRPFCHELERRTKTTGLTRAEIDKLDNGQLPDVFITGGGFNCRHQWILDPPNV